MKRIILLTGRAGVGKTSVLVRTMEVLRAKSYTVGGMVSSEFRKNGVRLGFSIVNLSTGEKGWLAHVNQPLGPQIGKYRVNLKDLNNIGVPAILEAVNCADVILIDELGPMELFSLIFKEAVMKAVQSNKPMVAILHKRVGDPLINTLKSREDSEILEVTIENRNSLHNILSYKIIQFTQREKSGKE